MTVKEQLEALIDADSYESCWGDAQHPSFDQFMKFTITAFEKMVPEDAINLKVTLRSNIDGRISTLGSFRRGEDEYEVFGEIVWVSKHKFFRGKPGFRKKVDPAPPLPDESDTFSLVSDTTKDLNGSGTMLLVSPRSLVRTFGPPGEGDAFKVSGMYIFEGDRGSAFRINDYEETTLYWGEERRGEYPTPEDHWNSDDLCEFRVVGNADPIKFVGWVRSRIERAPQQILEREA
jgi:hypothetical protein